jgi:hypothetical protein
LQDNWCLRKALTSGQSSLIFSFLSASNGTPTFKISALNMFGSFPGILGNQQSRNQEIVKQILKDCMAASSNYSVRFQAAKTFTSYVLHNRNDVVMHQHFQVHCFDFFCSCSDIKVSHIPRN